MGLLLLLLLLLLLFFLLLLLTLLLDQYLPLLAFFFLSLGCYLLILWAGMRLPRMHKLVARTMAMLRRAFTYPQVCEYGLCRLMASFCAIRLARVDTSRPIASRPSVETTKGVK
jgi:hypothetical protein